MDWIKLVKSPWFWLVVVILFLMVMAQVWAERQRGLMLALRQAQLSADSVEAVNARTETVRNRAIQFYARHAVQTEERLDSLSERYGMAVTSIANLTTRLQEAQRENRVLASVEEDSTLASPVLVVSDGQDFAMGRVEVEVRAVPPPDESIFTWALYPTPIPFEVSVGCRERGDGTYSAFWAVDTPEGIEADFGSAQVDPQVCNPLPAADRPWYDRWWIGAVATGAAAYLLSKE